MGFPLFWGLFASGEHTFMHVSPESPRLGCSPGRQHGSESPDPQQGRPAWPRPCLSHTQRGRCLCCRCVLGTCLVPWFHRSHTRRLAVFAVVVSRAPAWPQTLQVSHSHSESGCLCCRCVPGTCLALADIATGAGCVPQAHQGHRHGVDG